MLPFTAQPTKKRIKVASVDADGCIFRFDVLSTIIPRDVVTQNKVLLTHIKSEMAGYDKKILMSGSNRQSYRIDKVNADRNNTMLFADALLLIYQHLTSTQPTVELNKYLLADSYANLAHGHSFDLITAPDRHEHTNHKEYIFDKFKLSLLYAQMHKIASENPDDEIVFDFFDDREDILYSLQNTFSKHPELIPPNLTLHLYQYNNKILTPFFETKGNSNNLIDYNYQNNLYSILGMDPNSILRSNTEYVSNASLSNFVTTRQTDKSSTPFIAKFSTPPPPNPRTSSSNENYSRLIRDILAASANADTAGSRSSASRLPVASVKTLTSITPVVPVAPVAPGKSIASTNIRSLEANSCDTGNDPLSSAITVDATVDATEINNDVRTATLTAQSSASTLSIASVASETTTDIEPLKANSFAINKTPFFSSYSISKRTMVGMLLITLGAVIVTASLMVALESCGIATPLSAWGIKIGISILTTGIACACGAVGLGAVTTGLFMTRTQSDSTTEANNKACPAPPKHRTLTC